MLRVYPGLLLLVVLDAVAAVDEAKAAAAAVEA